MKVYFSSRRKSPIRSIGDGIDYLFYWNTKLSMLIGDIVGDETEEVLNKTLPRRRKPEISSCISKSVALKKIADLSEKILGLSDSMNVLIPICDNSEKEIDRDSHDFFIFQINSGLNTMRSARMIINTPKFDALKDSLIGLEENFKKFHSAYITALNTTDPNRTLQRPDEYDQKSSK